jgi:glutamate---cysteine ligase / carboxylate-amine ligase
MLREPDRMTERHHALRRPELPAWARWSGAATARPWTVGIEEELVLLDRRSWSAANRIDDVRAVLPVPLAVRTSAETHACVIELKTAAHRSVSSLATELTELRASLAQTLSARLGLRVAGVGTHPLAVRSQVAVASDVRYRQIDATMRALARREPTLALHIHVAVPDERAAVRALDGLRADLPLLLSVSANSPYWRGDDSGFASIRTPIFAMFPRVGIPRRFGTYGAYVGLVEAMLRSGAVLDPGYLWWDARLQPRLGTLEVRIMDAQSRVADVAAMAALVQCLIRRHAEGHPSRTLSPDVLAENRFLASRDGMSAWFIDGSAGPRRPAADAVAEMIERCAPTADALGCADELAGVSALAEEPGYARQRLIAARYGMPAVAAVLADEFIGARPAVAAA